MVHSVFYVFRWDV